MPTLRVHGLPDPRPDQSPLTRGLPQTAIRVKEAVVVQAARAGAVELSLPGLQPDDVVEIELQDGLRIWTRVDDLPADLERRASRGQVTDADVIELPSQLSIGPSSRSFGGWAVKALKVLGIDFAGEITDFIGEHVEGRLQPGPGLYQCTAAGDADLRPVRDLDGTGPVLLFLHGTASSTSGSFGGLWSTDGGRPIDPLFRHYTQRVLAFQHRTLTESPAQNAVDLVKALGAAVGRDREIHVVSHSRGGLVGELLALGMRVGTAPVTPEDLSLFQGANRAPDRAALQELSALLTQWRPRVTTFVRVACPARGTTLADGRLDRYFSILVNLASFIPGLMGNPMYEGLTNLLAGVLKKRTDPAELPGLEAMMPAAPLIRMLNRPDARTTADLHVLGGDLAGVGVFGRLKTFVTDLYYRDDHDLVVNTPSMFGGLDRGKPLPYWIDTGGQVTHFNYFGRKDTSRRLVAALMGSSADFREIKVAPSVVTSADYVKRTAVPQPTVFVLPGIMGSELSVDARPIWVKLFELSRGGLTMLGGRSAVTATGLLAASYGALCTHLAQTHAVQVFPYDWRRPIDESAVLLRKAIEAALPVAANADQPIRLLAHSMGGLVVRAMLATPEGHAVWREMCRHPGARFVMLGTPTGGSFAIPAMLMGRDALVKKLALLDLRNNHDELLQTIVAFEGMLGLLPQDDNGKYFTTAFWDELLAMDAPEDRGVFGSGAASSRSAGFRWTPPAADALARVRQLTAAMAATALDPARVTYVAGVADETASQIVIDPEAPSGRRVRVMATAAGDGRVLWSTGIPKGIRAYYMDAAHGDLANEARHFPAILDLLTTGTTSRLPATPPVRRSEDRPFEMRDRLPDMIPDEAELIADAVGGRRVRLDAPEVAPRVSVRVVHDNLTNALHPVLVGHYRHDVIVGAEWYLDTCLNQRLSELLKMELYPGPINTGVAAINEREAGSQARHPGAIVAGLGLVGELTPGSLTSTIAQALTLYGAELVGVERRRRHREGREIVDREVVAAPVSALLVGSGEGGISLADSLQAILRAVLLANDRLRRGQDGAPDGPGLVAQIDRVDLLELYEDRAIEALHQLQVIAESPEFQAATIAQLLVDGAEGQRRVRFDQQDPGWWQRIRVETCQDDDKNKGALRFEAVTQAARAPSLLKPQQRREVERFIDQAIGSTSSDPRIGRTLFEIVVPNDFKARAPDRRRLALMLDKESAAIPWELMQDGFDRTSKPLAVSSGLLRQLLVSQGREQVLRAPEATALVIGNPVVSDPRFPTLPGAEAEANEVANLLMGSGEIAVDLLVGSGADPQSVLMAIHERPWRMLHLAAHGVFDFAADDTDPDAARVSGLVLDDGLFFTAASADQMRYVPELVFINCCHLGQTRSADRVKFHRLAANLATQFIEMGARAVVAAGWAVDDGAARTFAKTFYREMLAGRLYGDAVLRAREATYLNHGGTNTWGAYQCYGDPSFSLGDGVSSRSDESFVSVAELRNWLEGVVARARQSSVRHQSLLADLRAREAQAAAPWWDSSALCAAAADAFSELGEYARAIEYYERTRSLEPALAPLRSLEQLANCRVRWAAALASQTPPDRDAAATMLDEAETLLDQLLAIGPSRERLALRGGLEKRRALVTRTRAGRLKALRAMSRYYGEAYAEAVKRRVSGRWPLGNHLAAEVVLTWRADRPSKEEVTKLLPRIAELEQGTAAGTGTDVFVLTIAAEAALLSALLQRDLTDASRDRIRRVYQQAFSRGITARQRDSLRAQVAFLGALALVELPVAQRAGIAQQLELLGQELFPADGRGGGR